MTEKFDAWWEKPIDEKRPNMTDHTEMQIPDDVMEAAIAAEKNMKFNGQTFVIAAIARAILAERERCARIAEGNAKSFNFQQALAEGDDMEVGAKSAQIAIAAKIRSVDK